MNKLWIAAGALLVAASAYAAEGGLKPGLWETRVVKQVMDGQDRTAQMAGAMNQMSQAMANMPPEQRARMEAMMKGRGAMGGGGPGSGGAYRVCISPEMAKREAPFVDREGHCAPATVQRSGNHTSFQINCSFEGMTSTGTGEATTSGDLITTKTQMTMRRANGETHVMQSETEMKYLGADCGDVKPPVRPAQAKPKPAS